MAMVGSPILRPRLLHLSNVSNSYFFDDATRVTSKRDLKVLTTEVSAGYPQHLRTVGSSLYGQICRNEIEFRAQRRLRAVQEPHVDLMELTEEDATSDGRSEAGATSAIVEEPLGFVQGSEVHGAAVNSTREEEISYATLVWRAVKLPLYSVAFIPLTVGAAAAYLQTGRFYASRYFSFLLFSVFVITWLNLSNDAFDADTGVDKDKKESVVNMTGSRNGVLLAAFTCLVIAGWGILSGAKAVKDPRVGAMLAASIGCGYIYQSPPFRLSYKGLGEPLCFFAFGPLATSAFYLYQANTLGGLTPPALSVTVLTASVLVGITTTLILFCSHFHQIEGDRAVGKMSPLVRIGTARGSKVVQFSVFALYALTAGFVAMGFLPFTCMVGALLTVPIGKLVIEFVGDNHTNKAKIFMAKYFCVRLHVAFGLTLATALALGRWRPF